MAAFPRTDVGGVSLPRLLVGTNWFLGYSHTSRAQDQFIKSFQTSANLARILTVFGEAGVDAIMGPQVQGLLREALDQAEQNTGHPFIRIVTPSFNISPGGPAEMEPERVIAACRDQGATFCMPHQAITDALVDRRDRTIRDLETYTRLIRQYGMIPGLSTHMPETVVYADAQQADVETYIQIYNGAGFLMQVEADWVMRIISNARKPVMTIKPLAAGRLLPVVGLAFVWNTLRDQDMVTVGTTTDDEAREVIDISLELLERRVPAYQLQATRSKDSLKAVAG
jgi:hypothetical protein